MVEATFWDIRATDQGQADLALPAAITREASKQTYYTIRLLVDRDRVVNAYRAYAYFRWVDDWIDTTLTEPLARIAFVERQSALIGGSYHGDLPHTLSAEERMVIDLIGSDPAPESGLRAYVEHMLAVMAFDAQRRGRLITQQELDDYTHDLAVAVTEALHYFIGHDLASPHTHARYLAVTGAHITHMLRDTYEDIAAGYFNVPREFLRQHQIEPWEIEGEAYRGWVKSRVELARSCFSAGRDYLRQVESRRCRLAGYAYMARFESVLEAIERDDYCLRADYRDCKSLKSGLKMGWTAFSLILSDFGAHSDLLDMRGTGEEI